MVAFPAAYLVVWPPKTTAVSGSGCSITAHLPPPHSLLPHRGVIVPPVHAWMLFVQLIACPVQPAPAALANCTVILGSASYPSCVHRPTREQIALHWESYDSRSLLIFPNVFSYGTTFLRQNIMFSHYEK